MPRPLTSQITTKKGGRRPNRRAKAQTSDSVGKYASDAWSLAKRTAYGLNEIRKLINIESKITQGTWSYSPDQTGFVQPITLMAQGTDYINQRVGDSIKLQRLEINVKFLQNGASTGTTIRYIVLRDLFQTGGGTPTPATLMETVGSQFSPLSPYNYLLRDRFGIVHDSLVDLSNNGDQCAALMLDIPHEGHVKYVGTTAAVASAGPGNLYIFVVSDEAANYPVVNTYWRVTYTDD